MERRQAQKLSEFLREELMHKLGIAEDEISMPDSQDDESMAMWVEVQEEVTKVIQDGTVAGLRKNQVAKSELDNTLDILMDNLESDCSGIIPEIRGDPEGSRRREAQHREQLNHQLDEINELRAAIGKKKLTRRY